MRRVIANLDAEVELADSARTPSRVALLQAARMGTLLDVFTRPGDALYLAHPLEEAPSPCPTHLESGPLDDLPPAEAVLAWCETPSVARHRRRTGASPGDPDAVLDGPLAEVPWRLPPPDPDTVARVHHRRWCLELADELGAALPGARFVASMVELEDHLAAGGADASPTGCWVIKAPLSAAGRDRYVENGRRIADGKPRATVERLFARHGELLFEPWMDRVEDLGVAALVAPDGAVRIVGTHRQRVDATGRFEAVDSTLPDDAARAALEDSARVVAEALHRAGYVGPFGVDAYRHRDIGGRVLLHPLGEVNARMTMGFLEHVRRATPEG